MTKSVFSKLAFVAAFGVSPIVVFTATLADASTHSMFYISTGLATAALGVQKDMLESAGDVGLSDIDPRLVKSEDIAYAVVDRKTALEMIENMKGQVGRADKDTVLLKAGSYAVAMLDTETIRAEPAYAELIDSEIDDNTVLILVVGAGAVQTLRGLGIKEAKLVLGDDAIDVFDTFAEFTLGLTPDTDGGDMPGAGKTSTLGASQPELADS